MSLFACECLFACVCLPVNQSVCRSLCSLLGPLSLPLSLSDLGVLNGLMGLIHGAIFGGDDENDDVSDVGAPASHGGEGGVTWRVEEGDTCARSRQREGKGADVLRDTAKLLADGTIENTSL